MSKDSYLHKDIEKLSESLVKKLDDLNEVLSKLDAAGVWVNIEKDINGKLFQLNTVRQYITYYEAKKK